MTVILIVSDCRRSKRLRLRPFFYLIGLVGSSSRPPLRRTNFNKRFYLRYTMMIIGPRVIPVRGSNFIKQRLHLIEITGILRDTILKK